MGAAKDTFEAFERVGEVDVAGAPTWRKDLRLNEESWCSGEATGESESSSPFCGVLFAVDFVQANSEGRFGCRGTWGRVSRGGGSG